MSSLHAGRPFAALAIPPPRALSSSQRKQGVWPGGSAVVGMSSLHATATSYSIRHFWVRKGLEAMRQPGTPAGTAGLT